VPPRLRLYDPAKFHADRGDLMAKISDKKVFLQVLKEMSCQVLTNR
jgi:hypothetical protein